jgi:hypothetical protein
MQWRYDEDSRLSNEWYLIIYPENFSGPLVEIWKTETGTLGQQRLVWTNKPMKRDGQNKDRTGYFTRYFRDTRVHIDLPESGTGIPDFIEECYILVDNRIKADALDDSPPMTRDSFPEGREHERRHVLRERNPKVARHAKERFKLQHGCLHCQVCKFDFSKVYGALGDDVIEAHHVVPISELEEGAQTRVEDIVLVCANCHRMLHRKRPWISYSQLQLILNESSTNC